MNYDTRPFLALLSKVRLDVKAEIARRNDGGTGGPGDLHQLDYIVKDLDRVEAEIGSGRLPVGKNRLESAYIVTDSWPFDDPLGLEIARLGNLYQELCIL